MATEFCKWYSYRLFPVGVETSCVAFQSLALLSLVIGLMMVLQSWWSWWAHSVAVYVCVQCPCQQCTKKKHKKQPINSMNGKKYFVLWFCIKIWAINWHSNHIEDLKQSHWAQGSGVHSRALFSHFQVLLSMQTERPRDKADWACWLAQGGGGVILQVH